MNAVAGDLTPDQMGSILIVEDEELLREITTTILERAGFHVFQASNAAEALEVWRREHSSIHVLLADILLPDGTGVELASEFRRTVPALNVIFTSGSDRKVVIETQQMVRGATFLRKPYTIRFLIEAVRAALIEAAKNSQPNCLPQFASAS
jgi:DNA-binding NtrC family response regulator